MRPLLLWLICLCAFPALAEVGRVSQLEGEASRTASGGTVETLEEGSAVEVGDVIDVKAGGNLALLLTDESTLVIAGGSQLRIDEATFSGLERQSFSARLMFGTVWAKVKKAVAGSTAKFEVTTQRTVAGVRGTTFQVELADDEARVDVEEGLVEVQHDGDAPEQPGKLARQVLQVRGGERVRLQRLRVFRERFVGPQGKLEHFVRAARERTERLRQLPPDRRFLRDLREQQRDRLRERRNRR